jgi:hypothetical protein
MFDAQITVALFAAFLLGNGRRQWDRDHYEGLAALDSCFD